MYFRNFVFPLIFQEDFNQTNLKDQIRTFYELFAINVQKLDLCDDQTLLLPLENLANRYFEHVKMSSFYKVRYLSKDLII